jgi:hypothetical protein
LSGKLLKHLPRQLNRIVLKILKLHKLHQIPRRSPAPRIHQLTIIVIQLMHDPKITIPNPHNNQAHRQRTTLNYLINDLLFVMNLPVSQDKHDKVLVVCSLGLACLAYCVLQEFAEHRRPTKLHARESLTVGFHDAVNLEDIGILHIAVQGKTVINLAICVIVGHVDFSPKPIQRHQLIIIVVQEYLRHLIQRLLILRHPPRGNIVQ